MLIISWIRRFYHLVIYADIQDDQSFYYWIPVFSKMTFGYMRTIPILISPNDSFAWMLYVFLHRKGRQSNFI